MNAMPFALNVLGEALATCSCDPVTGWFRTGDCFGDARDAGMHVVCAEMTDAFLTFSRQQGNDLSTPQPEFNFPGLKPGDHWCVCAARWLEAYEAGCAPPVDLAATHEVALTVVPMSALARHKLPEIE
jgi:uncharacterized protein